MTLPVELGQCDGPPYVESTAGVGDWVQEQAIGLLHDGESVALDDAWLDREVAREELADHLGEARKKLAPIFEDERRARLDARKAHHMLQLAERTRSGADLAPELAECQRADHEVRRAQRVLESMRDAFGAETQQLQARVDQLTELLGEEA